ncbi:HlyD family efflux transporter periplasmic adaptor subunit [Thalassococcus sp. CAU 1522]|uniref:HlyD family efflux transporter periplasmic adaptor subunit n=1 Tax=Thalassococcus arenae TaxID=2851652 RepID=A0ABS6N918_9RHOB|nr:HlyD family secretion protein [Thalassococcus arenae]MBV2360484.1 HlyD family efflux transporter periplasmic adaptor subunit [Thalassococcus arenae]
MTTARHAFFAAAILCTALSAPMAAQDDRISEVFLGTVRASDIHGLSYEARGCITEVAQDIDRDPTARAGQVLVRLNDRQSALSLQTAAARLLDLDAAVEERILALRAARADDRRRQQELAFVAKEFERNNTLFRRGLINETTLEAVERRVMDAEFAAERAKEAIDSAVSAVSRAEIARDIGRLERQSAEINHANLSVVAPFDGVLLGFEAKVGDCVQEGQLAAQIYAPHRKVVDIHVLIGTVAPSTPDGLAIGAPVVLHRVTGPDCDGTVIQIGTEADLETQYVKATIEVDPTCAPALFLNEAVEVEAASASAG